MLAADQSTNPLLASWSTALYPIHNRTISLHHAKAGYDYRTIRLPHTFSKLAGLPTRIYQTAYKGAPAFLVVIAPSHSASEHNAEKSENAMTDADTFAFYD